MPDQTFTHTYATPGQFTPTYNKSDGSGTVPGNQVTVLDPGAQLATPTGVTAQAAETTATVSWTAAPGANSYTVSYRDKAVGGAYTDVVVPASPAELTALTTGLTYEVHVTAKDTTGGHPDSAASTPDVEFTTGTTAATITPDKTTVDPGGDAAARTITVAGTGFTASTPGTVKLFTGAPASGGTEVPGATANFTADAAGAFTGAAVVVPAAQAAGDYHLVATDGTITSDNTAITVAGAAAATITPDKTTIDSSGDATARTVTTGGTGFPANGTAGHLGIHAGAPGSGGALVIGRDDIATDAAGAFTAATLEVPAGQAAGDYHLLATIGGVTSDDTALTVTGGATPLPQVTGLATATPTSTTIDLGWTATDPAAVAYHVQYRTPAGTGAWLDFTPDQATTEVVVTGLTAATEYEFQVKAVGDGTTTGDGIYSAPATGTTTA